MTSTLKKSTNQNSQTSIPSEPDLTPIDNELDLELLQKAAVDEADSSEPTFSLSCRHDERTLALNLLYALDRAENSVSFSDIVKAFEQGFDIKISKTTFAFRVAQGVDKERDELDKQLLPYLKNWRLERLGCCTLLVLRIALWEMQQPNAVTSIIINEAVELAKTFAEKDAYRFVNGILDEIAKALYGEKEEEPKKEPAVKKEPSIKKEPAVKKEAKKKKPSQSKKKVKESK